MLAAMTDYAASPSETYISLTASSLLVIRPSLGIISLLRQNQQSPVSGSTGWDCLGAATSDAISARSNFGLGFALTHTLIKSDESHHRKFTSLSISSAFPG